MFPGLQGGPLMHVIAAKAVAFHEARAARFRDYAAQIVRNARALADGLAAEGFRIVSGGTDNHLMLVDLRPFGVTGKVAQEALDRAGITCNKNAIPNDPEKPFVTSGLRLGTAAVTTAGMGEPEMAEIAALIAAVLRDARRRRTSPTTCATRRDRLCAKFTPYPELAVSRSAVAWYGYLLVGVAALVDVPRSRSSCAGSRRASARSSLPGPAQRAHGARRRTLGGAAMFVGFLVAMAVASQIPQFHEMFDDASEPLGLLLAAGVMFVVGAVDDLREVSPPAKIAGQVLAGSVLSLLRRHDALLPRPVRELRLRRALARPRAARHRAHRRRAGERDQPHRRPRRPRRRAS